MRVRKGILFADDPVFKGKQRELVAADYVYSIKRSLDPNLRTGWRRRPDRPDRRRSAGRRCRAQAGAKFDYDAQIEGLQAPDRYTLVHAPAIRITRCSSDSRACR
jgi:hypothetical protein